MPFTPLKEVEGRRGSAGESLKLSTHANSLRRTLLTFLPIMISTNSLFKFPQVSCTKALYKSLLRKANMQIEEGSVPSNCPEQLEEPPRRRLSQDMGGCPRGRTRKSVKVSENQICPKIYPKDGWETQPPIVQVLPVSAQTSKGIVICCRIHAIVFKCGNQCLKMARTLQDWQVGPHIMQCVHAQAEALPKSRAPFPVCRRSLDTPQTLL